MANIDMLLQLSRLVKAKNITFFTIKSPKRNTGTFNVDKFKKGIDVTVRAIDGYKTITASTANCKNKHIVFFHGGAYVSEGMGLHRRLVEKMVTKYGYKVSYVDYPLAPENKAPYVVDVAKRSYAMMDNNYPDDELYLFGDSAGGGLAVEILMSLRDENFARKPVKTALASPWVDISMENPALENFDKFDPLLPYNGLILAGKAYSGDLGTKHPLVSPLYAEMNDIGELLVTCGGHEMLCPDITKFVAKLKRTKGVNVQLVFKEDMFHDWVVAPIKEADETLDAIFNFYNGN